MSQNIDIHSGVGQSLTLHSQVEVAQNEPLCKETINRCIAALASNDIDVLEKLHKAIFSQLNITDYVENTAYDAGDLIWYKDYATKNIFLLQCIANNNTQKPDIYANDPSLSDYYLNMSGWENQNKSLTILDYGISELLSATSQSFVDQHQNNDKYHPFGKISFDASDDDYIGKKLLYSNLSNISQERTSIFFPRVVTKLDEGNAIMTGYERNFGKIVEYDIILKFANNSNFDPNAIFDSASAISANTASFQMFSGISNQSIDFQTNKEYFSSAADMDIFAPKSDGQSRCGLIVQLQRNDYANTYSANITFPRAFINLNYMVFSNTLLSQTLGNNTLVPSANDISYCNKTRQSITLLDITFPDSAKYGDIGYNAKNGGLASNSFHCKIIGQIGA